MKKISIIIPVFNAEKFIAKCLDSIVNQTYKNLQIIVVNDASKDNTEKIVKEFMKKYNQIELINFATNKGVSHARNIGVKQADGDLISFVDADDWVEYNMYEVMAKKINETNTDVVRCSNYIENINLNKTIKAPYYGLGNTCISDSKTKEIFLQNILVRLPCYVSLLLMDRKIAEKIEFDTKIRILEDKLYYCELIGKAKNIYCLDMPLYHYCINSNSASKRSDRYELYIYDIVRVVNKMLEVLQENEMLCEDVEKKIKNMYITVIDRYLYNIYKTLGIEKVKLIYKELKDDIFFSDINNIYNKKYIKNNKLEYRFTTKFLINQDYSKLKIMYGIYRLYDPINNKILDLKIFIKQLLEKER